MSIELPLGGLQVFQANLLVPLQVRPHILQNEEECTKEKLFC